MKLDKMTKEKIDSYFHGLSEEEKGNLQDALMKKYEESLLRGKTIYIESDLIGKTEDARCCLIDNMGDIEPILELGCACCFAGSNGCVKLWIDDKNKIRAELYKFQISIEKRTFLSYNEAEECISEWIKDIE